MRNLPLGTQTFEELRNSDCVYVDKTEHIYRMIKEGRVYFLSRPRRFGKSLLVSTLESIDYLNDTKMDMEQLTNYSVANHSLM
jgi:hypothetical protein